MSTHKQSHDPYNKVYITPEHNTNARIFHCTQFYSFSLQCIIHYKNLFASGKTACITMRFLYEVHEKNTHKAGYVCLCA